MKIINAFVAADDELAMEREEFIKMVGEVNRVLAARGYEVHACGYDPARHSEMLSGSEIAFVMYHTKCGDFAGKEVDDAYERIVQKQNPKRLYIFFKNDDGRPLDPSFVEFRDSFVKRFEHFFCAFENVDTLKLNFLLSLENLISQDGGEQFVKLDGTSVNVDGVNIGNIRKLPMISKNAGMNGLFVRLDELKTAFERQKEVVDKDPTSEDAYGELLDLSSRVTEMEDRVDRELAMSFGLAKRMSSVTIGETNETLARARAAMERGEIKQAIEILEAADVTGNMTRLLRRKAEEVDEAKLEAKEFAACVDLELFRIKALQHYAGMSEDERNAKIAEIRDGLLGELAEYRENSSVQLTAEIDIMIERVKNCEG